MFVSPDAKSFLCGLGIVSQTRPTSAKNREGSSELCIQAMSCCTVQCGPITLQYFVSSAKHSVKTLMKLFSELKFVTDNLPLQLYALHSVSCSSLSYPGRTARLQKKGKATSFLTLECKIASQLKDLLASLDQPIPPALENMKQFGKRVIRTELGDRTID